ncbi:MAG: penicillin acylase family protein [Chloroflexi bacterium]|nr:penicillin acylase family protein [Chloroflexota bacterium]
MVWRRPRPFCAKPSAPNPRIGSGAACIKSPSPTPWGACRCWPASSTRGRAPSAATQPPSPRPATAPTPPYDNNAIGVSSRLVVAFGAAAAAWAMLAPGQSGQPGSPHYGDLITPWLSGDYLEIAWTVEEITAVSPHTLTLTPPPSH